MAMQTHVLDASSIVKMCLTRGLKPPQNPTTIDLAKCETFNAILVLSRRGLLRDEEVSRVVSYAESILSKIKNIKYRILKRCEKCTRWHINTDLQCMTQHTFIQPRN
jgi:predicted DNA-binding transcriptional regulator